MIEPIMMEHGRKDRKNESIMKKTGVFFLLLILLELPLSVLVSGLSDVFPKEYGTLVSLLATQVYLLAGTVIFIRLSGISGRELGLTAFRLKSLIPMLLLFCLSGIVAMWLNLFSQLFVKNEVAGLVYNITRVLPMWLGILLIGCLPGIVEELIYRGILYSVFRKRSVFTGVMVSALSFGLMHMNLNQIAYAIFMGMLFALVVEATGSLLSSMLMHAVFNAINVVSLYRSSEMLKEAGQQIEEQAAFKAELLHFLGPLTPMAVIALYLSMKQFRMLAKMNGRDFSGEDAGTETAKPVSLPLSLIAGWLVCLLIAVVNMVLEL